MQNIYFSSRLLINPYISKSEIEAEQSRQRLQSLVEQLLRSNYDISLRLQSIEETLATRSILTSCFRNNNIPDILEDKPYAEQASLLEPYTAAFTLDRSVLVTDSYIGDSTGFEVDLETSRVYRRTEQFNVRYIIYELCYKKPRLVDIFWLESI
jgi:hypothetical protein